MQCSNCGRVFQAGDSFCYGCGTPFPAQAGMAEEPPAAPSFAQAPSEIRQQEYTASVPAMAAVAGDPPVPPPPAIPGASVAPAEAQTAIPVHPVRYSRLMGLMLVLIVSASIALFLVVEAGCRHAPGNLYRTAAPLLLFALVVGKFALDQAKEIRAHPEPRGYNNLLKAYVAVALMFFTVAFLTGWQMGTRRFAFDQMITDWGHLSRVGRSISSQRDAVNRQDISAQIEMYKAIEKDVVEMDTTTQRLMEEERKFVERYPEYAAQSGREMADLDAVRQRASLLRRQIEVARRISAESNQQQNKVWAKEMEPLLHEEDQLNVPSQPEPE